MLIQWTHRILSGGRMLWARASDVVLVAQTEARLRGQGLVEYAIVIALVAVIALAAIQTFGGGIEGLFTRLTGRFSGLG